ncbi:hypothetical protein ACIBUY_19380 [Streptomyces sp. NPDC050085]|uniref:hypothetical protein n=1 Tax=Streptomyces sp. NPDC050085 TaxID=3365600 RepID=UPI0037B19FAE
MTSQTTLPVPAGRLLRAAVGRRALQLALLLGGLIGLGLLCGGQAHADDSVGSLLQRHAAVHEVGEVRPMREVRERVVERVRDLAPVRATEAVRATEPVHATEAVRVTEPVRDKVVRPVADVVRQVVRPVGELTGQVVEGLAGAASRPLPSGTPRLPGLPGWPGGSDPEPAPSVPPVPSAPADRSGTAAPASAHAAEGEHHKRSAEVAGPKAYGAALFSDVPAHEPHRGSTAARHTAAQSPAPGGIPTRPDGAPVANASAGDGSSTRHGDLHAAAFDSRVPVLLPPGAPASARPAPVADRHRDIPEFPG